MSREVDRTGAVRCVGAAALAASWTFGSLGIAAEAVRAPEAQMEAAGVVSYHLGKGPGGNNSYVARYEEDFSYLRDPARSTDIFDPLKLVPFDEAKDFYLTLTGEIRSRNDFTEHKNLGVAATATPTRTGPPRLTAATRGNENELYKQRYALGGDLHLGDNLRLYADLYHGQQTGREVGPVVPANQRNQLSLVDGFVEPYGMVGGAKLGLRVGRQILFFGDALNVGANLATNLPDPPFDGARVYADWGAARVDVFAFNRVKYVEGVLADVESPRTNLWGAYASIDVSPFSVLGATAATSTDLFYFGFRSTSNANATGSGFYNDRALLTGGTVSGTSGSGFVPSQDHRHTLGVRYHGAAGPVDFDWEAMAQRGSYGGLDVAAWAINTDTGYTFTSLPWTPRIGTHADAASGGASRSDGKIYTYQPLYPDTYYYLPNSVFSPTNFYDVSPRLSVVPAPGLRIDFYYAFLWRYSVEDAVYTGNWKGAGSANAYSPTVLSSGRFIGMQPDIAVFWAPVEHLRFRVEYAVFFPGAALSAAQAKTTSYVNLTAQLKF